MTLALTEALKAGPRLFDSLYTFVRRLPSRLGDRHFWVVQLAIGVITATHILTESLYPESYVDLHHIVVTLYVLPIVYASIHFGWEGGSSAACGSCSWPPRTLSYGIRPTTPG